MNKRTFLKRGIPALVGGIVLSQYTFNQAKAQILPNPPAYEQYYITFAPRLQQLQVDVELTFAHPNCRNCDTYTCSFNWWKGTVLFVANPNEPTRSIQTQQDLYLYEYMFDVDGISPWTIDSRGSWGNNLSRSIDANGVIPGGTGAYIVALPLFQDRFQSKVWVTPGIVGGLVP